MELKRAFARNLKAIRQDRGYTQESLAEKLKISARYIQFLEGKHTPNVTLDTIEKFAKVLKIKPTKLLD